MGETSEEFAIEVGDLPWEWEAQPSQTTVDLNPDDSATITMEVDIPNTAAVDEYAENPTNSPCSNVFLQLHLWICNN